MAIWSRSVYKYVIKCILAISGRRVSETRLGFFFLYLVLAINFARYLPEQIRSVDFWRNRPTQTRRASTLLYRYRS